MQRLISRFIGGALALALSAGGAQAQTPERIWDFGLTAGVNIATIGGSDADDADNLTGFFAGASMVFPINSMWSFQPEVIYSRKGAKGRFEGIPIELKLDYIDIPLLAKIFVGPGPAMRPVLYFGPSIGFNINCEAEGSEGGITVTADCDDFGFPVKDLDIGVIGGAGLDFERFSVFARYQYGLTKIDDSGEGAKAYNRVIQIGGRVRIW